jgi:DNA invertase Pin-like site-specific DNA recombinase
MEATAWLLAVVSSDGQSETLEFQERWGREVAAANCWTIARTFKDVSSGKHGTRPMLKDLLSELRALPKSARPGRILLVRLDRIGRGDGLDTISTLSEIKKLGVTMHTRDDGDVRLEKASDSIMPAIKAILAGIENEVRADRTRAGIARRRAQGKHQGNPPYGATLIEGRPAVFEPEAVLVRELFRLRRDGWGYDRLAHYAAQHALPKTLKGGKTRRLKWGRSTIQRLLWCVTLRELVVDGGLFDSVQGARGPAFRARRIQSWPFPLAHAVRCSCGNMLSGQTSGRKGYRIRYLVCGRIAEHYFYPHHNAAEIERQFQGLLGRLRASPELLAPVSGRADVPGLRAREAALNVSLASLETRERRVWELAEAGNIPATQLRVRLDAISEDRGRYRSELESLAVEINAAERLSQQRLTVEQVFREVEASWHELPLDLQQRCAGAVSEIVGGLWLAPGKRGRGRRRIQSTLTLGIGGPAYVAENGHNLENMREIDTLRNVDMAQRKADDSITKKFIQSITE